MLIKVRAVRSHSTREPLTLKSTFSTDGKKGAFKISLTIANQAREAGITLNAHALRKKEVMGS